MICRIISIKLFPVKMVGWTLMYTSQSLLSVCLLYLLGQIAVALSYNCYNNNLNKYNMYFTWFCILKHHKLVSHVDRNPFTVDKSCSIICLETVFNLLDPQNVMCYLFLTTFMKLKR